MRKRNIKLAWLSSAFGIAAENGLITVSDSEKATYRLKAD